MVRSVLSPACALSPSFHGLPSPSAARLGGSRLCCFTAPGAHLGSQVSASACPLPCPSDLTQPPGPRGGPHLSPEFSDSSGHCSRPRGGRWRGRGHAAGDTAGRARGLWRSRTWYCHLTEEFFLLVTVRRSDGRMHVAALEPCARPSVLSGTGGAADGAAALCPRCMEAEV